MSPTPKERWIWMPHAAHFIGATHCHFRLATYVGGYIVSTVGELFWSEGTNRNSAHFRDPDWLAANLLRRGDDFQSAYFKHFGYEQIGLNRTYETMVFAALPSEACDACPWVIDASEELDFDGYTDPGAAYQGHLTLCEKWAARTPNEIAP